MGKYTSVFLDIESVFGSQDWIAEKIFTTSSTFTGTVAQDEFVKTEILPLESEASYDRNGIRGQVIVQIYIESGFGSMRVNEIADILDNYLQNKSFINGTSTGSSVLNILGIDRLNPALYRGDYTVDFVNFN